MFILLIYGVPLDWSPCGVQMHKQPLPHASSCYSWWIAGNHMLGVEPCFHQGQRGIERRHQRHSPNQKKRHLRLGHSHRMRLFKRDCLKRGHTTSLKHVHTLLGCPLYRKPSIWEAAIDLSCRNCYLRWPPTYTCLSQVNQLPELKLSSAGGDSHPRKFLSLHL